MCSKPWIRVMAIGAIVFVAASDDSLAGELGAWFDRSPAVLPPQARAPEMTYDKSREVCVLFGGAANQTSVPYGETWEWDGNNWNMADSNGPARAGHSLAYDASRQVVVLFGGGSPTERFGDTWQWDGAVWTQVSAGDPAGVLAPAPRTQHCMAFDSQRGVVVLFGGIVEAGGVNIANNETWEWNGTDWTLVSTSGPAPRSMAAMAYDEASQSVVLFGGSDGTQVFDDTWAYDGSAWIEHQVPGPSARRGARMEYHSARNTTVLFGGNDKPQGNDGSMFNDTWEWNGTSWSLAISSGSMTPRHSSGFAYDGARDAIVLAGGSVLGDQGISDTWELFSDCNSNSMPDTDDIINGSSLDCNTNGIPDECEADFDGDGLIDDCDQDIDSDGVPNAEDVCVYGPVGAPVDCEGRPRGDMDGDCDIDLADFAIFQKYFTGPQS